MRATRPTTLATTLLLLTLGLTGCSDDSAPESESSASPSAFNCWYSARNCAKAAR